MEFYRIVVVVSSIELIILRIDKKKLNRNSLDDIRHHRKLHAESIHETERVCTTTIYCSVNKHAPHSHMPSIETKTDSTATLIRSAQNWDDIQRRQKSYRKKNRTQNCQQVDCVQHLFGQVILTPIRWWPNGIADNKKNSRKRKKCERIIYAYATLCDRLLPNRISNYISIFGHNTNNEIGYTEISSQWLTVFATKSVFMERWLCRLPEVFLATRWKMRRKWESERERKSESIKCIMLWVRSRRHQLRLRLFVCVCVCVSPWITIK